MSCCRCRILAGLLDRLGGGSAAQYQHANKGRGGPCLGLLAGQERRSLRSRTGWPPLLRPSSVVQHGMQAMTPLVSLRLTPPKELALHCLHGILLPIGQDQEPLIRHRG
jgi:hypothetical protein